MPESFPNAFDLSVFGEVASSYLLIAGAPTSNKRIDWGFTGDLTGGTGPFINAFPESSTTLCTHRLGVVPSVWFVGGVYTDGGEFEAFLNGAATSSGFGFFVRDILGGTHGPGNLANVFPYLAIE